MTRTTIAVSNDTRAKLAELTEQAGADSADAMLRQLIFEHECHAALARLDADPDALAEYRAEALEWAELDMDVPE